jgi:hypothetical protein
MNRCPEIDQLNRFFGGTHVQVYPDAPQEYNTHRFERVAGNERIPMRLNGKPQLQLIVHMGTKKNEMPAGAIQDPQKILNWLGSDRACVNFTSLGSVDASAQALKDILQQWIQHIPAAQAAG